jgi:hypothetical protein
MPFAMSKTATKNSESAFAGQQGRLGRTARYILLGCLILVSRPAWAVDAPSAQDLLRASDDIRNPDRPFVLSVRLTEFRDLTRRDSSTLSVYARMDSRRGQFDNLIRITEPLRDAGKLLLKNGNEIWLYDPQGRSSIRINPQQRLLGQASNGDVVTTNLARDYRSEIVGKEEIQDGDKKNRSCYRLRLDRSASDVAYAAVEYWVEEGTNRPVKGRFLSDSGRVLKTAYYRRYRKELGKERPTETVIIDGLNPGWVTVMQFDAFEYREMPDQWFQRAFLSSFRD